LVVYLDQLFHRDVCVNLSSRKAGVPEQRLNVALIGAAVEQMRGKRMSESVWADIVHAGAKPYVFFNEAANRPRGHPSSLVVENQWLRVSFCCRRFHEKGFAHRKIIFQSFQG